MDNPTEPDDVPAESDHAETCAARLDQKLADLLAKVEASEVYRIMSDPQTDPLLVGAILKYSLLEVFSYGPHVTEATFTAIGRMPKTRPDLMKPMILHDIGDEAWARSRRISPASYVLGATCRLLAQQESPFSYLGYMYLFETLTPILTARLLEILKVKGIRADAQYFVQFHSTEDISHSKALRGLVKRVVRDYPEAAEAIDYGYECFCCTYPLPVWDTALQNALAEVRR
jgi:hypothetical protein